MTVVLGLDQSTTITGWAAGTERTQAIFGKIVCPKREVLGERLGFFMQRLDALVREIRPDLMLAEEQFFPVGGAFQPKRGRRNGASGFLPAQIEQDEPEGGKAAFNPKVIAALQKVTGIVEAVAALHGIPLEIVRTSTWRGTFLGYSRKPAGEDDLFLKRMCRQRAVALGYDVTTFDEAEAIGITYHGLHGKGAAARKQADLWALAGETL